MQSDLEQRFWAKVNKEPPSGCWEWTGYSDRYGHINHNGKKIGAHRMSWELHFGKIPTGLCACHKCDNPICVNPAHLFIATHAENMHDMAQKGRCDHPYKLSRQQVVEIRTKYAAGGVSQKELAIQYDIKSQSYIGGIVRGEKWPRAGGPITHRGSGNRMQ